MASGKPVGTAGAARLRRRCALAARQPQPYTYTQTRLEMKPGQPVTETYMDAQRAAGSAWAARRTGGRCSGPPSPRQLGLVRLDVGQLYTVPRAAPGWWRAPPTPRCPKARLFAAPAGRPGHAEDCAGSALATEADKVVDIALQGNAPLRDDCRPARRGARWCASICNKPGAALALAPVVAAAAQGRRAARLRAHANGA